MCAAWSGHTKIVGMLLERGADTNATDEVIDKHMFRLGVMRGWFLSRV